MKTFDTTIPSVIDPMIADAIKRVQTNAHMAKDIAADLRENGFDGIVMSDLRKAAELMLKSVHEYQAYVNAKNASTSL